MYTRFDQHNQDFSDKAHAAAQSLVYPFLFDCHENCLAFESFSVGDGGEKAVMDGQMAIDRTVKVTVQSFRRPIEHTIQERFRRPGYKAYRDLTITEWNNPTNLPSELYKIRAALIVYGYYNEELNEFGEVIVINTEAFLLSMTKREVTYTKKQNKKGQDFIAVSFDDLHAAGVVVAHMNAPQFLALSIDNEWRYL